MSVGQRLMKSFSLFTRQVNWKSGKISENKSLQSFECHSSGNLSLDWFVKPLSASSGCSSCREERETRNMYKLGKVVVDDNERMKERENNCTTQ